ncbi:MAG: hypothetical protein GC168_06060 [Candidatus Hydrogenedens sp.]|nr:hypothetical protein [Candidatus Hydrogenedens sp.]
MIPRMFAISSQSVPGFRRACAIIAVIVVAASCGVAVAGQPLYDTQGAFWAADGIGGTAAVAPIPGGSGDGSGLPGVAGPALMRAALDEAPVALCVSVTRDASYSITGRGILEQQRRLRL